MARLLFELVGLPLRLIGLGSLFCHVDFPSLSQSGMAWAGATRQTAITMSRFVRGIFSATRGDDGRPDAKRVSRKGALGWFWRCSRVVAHYCHAITIANAGLVWLLNIAQEGLVELDAESLSARSSRFLPKLSSFGQTPKGQHRNLNASIGRESSATRVASISSMWRSLGEQVSKLAAPTPPLRRILLVMSRSDRPSPQTKAQSVTRKSGICWL
jgi:hypothetical protein